MQIFRNGILIVVLISFFFTISIARADNQAELAQKFAAAQQLAAQGKTKQAIIAYKTLIRLNPLLPEAYNNLAALYLKQKNVKEAKYILEQGLHAHKGYGVLYESLTAINVAMAREAYSKALQIDIKPSDIAIASLSFSEQKQKQSKNTIVISKDTKETTDPSVNTNKEIQTAKAENPSGAIKRVIANNRPAKKIQPTNNAESITKVLKAWSAAWSAQAVDIYLSFYHRQYKPSNGLSRKGWVQSRRYRLKKPDWIKVGLSNLRVEKSSARQAVVRFNQSYRSNSFSDESAKQLVMLYTEDGWKIFREFSL